MVERLNRPLLQLHNGRKRFMTAQQKAESSMLEMLSGYMCQQLASWMRGGKENGL